MSKTVVQKVTYRVRKMLKYLSTNPTELWIGRITLSQRKKDRTVLIQYEAIEPKPGTYFSDLVNMVLNNPFILNELLQGEIESIILQHNIVDCLTGQMPPRTMIKYAVAPTETHCFPKMGFLDFCKMIGNLLDENGWDIEFESYREETEDGKTIEETIRDKFRRRTYWLCHRSAIDDPSAWKSRISGLGLTPENAAKRLGARLISEESVSDRGKIYSILPSHLLLIEVTDEN